MKATITGFDAAPSAGALKKVRGLAGPFAIIVDVARLEGGQHAATWRVTTKNPALSAVVRQFPLGDSAACREQRVLRALDGVGGLAPLPLGGDLHGRWSEHPTSLISWLDGEPDIAPSDLQRWASVLGRALALVHALPSGRLARLPSVFDARGSRDELNGPLAAAVRSRWSLIVDSPGVLIHGDYWSGNVLWRDRSLTGVVDWSGAACGPRGFDVGWCRLDLVLLFDERIADVFLAAYEAATGETLGEVDLWDAWAAARSPDTAETWLRTTHRWGEVT